MDVRDDGFVVDRPCRGGGRLLVLPVNPAAMADPAGTVGRDTIRELARRAVLADGRSLVQVNRYLREALADGHQGSNQRRNAGGENGNPAGGRFPPHHDPRNRRTSCTVMNRNAIRLCKQRPAAQRAEYYPLLPLVEH